jgi:hypothetical protein
MKRVGINLAFEDAIESTEQGLSRFPIQMLKWGKYIERAIGSKRGYKVKAKTFTVTGCSIELPDDFYAVIGIYLGDYEDECNVRYKDINVPSLSEDIRNNEDVYDRDLTFTWQPLNTTWVDEILYEEYGSELQFVNEYNDQKITLVYSYNEKDLKGNWIVNESHIMAISKYIQFRYAQKFRWKMFKSDKLLRSGHKMVLQDLETEYNREIRNARALDGAENSYERNQY